MTELSRLRVEQSDAPQAVWTLRPRFSWQLSGGDDVRQVAYEVIVSTRDGQELLSTGRVESTASHLVDCLSEDLPHATELSWRVRTWTTGSQEPTSWAEAEFETARLGPWQAPWVEPDQQPVQLDGPTTLAEVFVPRIAAPVDERLHPAIMIRHRFELDQLPVQARLRATAHGVYQAELNGAGVGDQVLAPGYESYQHAVSYQTYDVTDQLVAGANVLGLELSDGWYAGRISFLGRSAQYGDRLRASWQLELTLADGSTTVVVPQPDTCVSSVDGPIRYADLFIGERHDARRQRRGWSTATFDDSTWSPVTVTDLDVPVLPFVGEPVRRVAEIAAVEVITTPAGETVIDFGQVVAGRVRLSVTGRSGTEITLEHGETLDQAGNYLNNILGANKDQADTYVLRGEPTGETWEPTFTFHGFRYVRVSGYPGTVEPGAFTAIVLASDLDYGGRWSSDDARLNRLHENVVWSQRANFLAVPTDCPQRERAGWTGDAQIFAPAAANNADISTFMDRWLATVRADQADDGCVAIISPMPPAMAAQWEQGADGEDDLLAAIRAAAGWGDLITFLPLILWQRYADRRVLADNYPAMQAWVELQRRQAEDQLPERLADADLGEAERAQHALLWNGEPNFGDWLAPSTVDATDPQSMLVAPKLTGELVGAAFGVQSLTAIGQVAEILGDDEAARDYRDRASAARAAFTAVYLDDQDQLPTALQGPYVLALAFDLVPENRRAGLVARLVELVHANGDRLDTGFVSVPYLLDVLADHGHAELARTLLWQSECPSWLYAVDRGATTIWEAWDAVRPDGEVGAVSFNHYAFGCVDDFLYRRIAGLQPVEPGFSRSRVAPDLDAPLNDVRAEIATPYGKLATSWSRSHDGAVTIDVTVTGNTATTIVLPEGWTSTDPLADLGSGDHTVVARRR